MRTLTIALLLASSGLALADDGKPTEPGEPLVAFYQQLTKNLLAVGKGGEPKATFGEGWTVEFDDLAAWRESFAARKVTRVRAIGTDLALAFTRAGKTVETIRFVYSGSDKPTLMFGEVRGARGGEAPKPLKAGPQSVIGPLHRVGERFYSRLKDGGRPSLATVDQLLAWAPFPVPREQMEKRYKKLNAGWTSFLDGFKKLEADGAMLVGVGETIVLCHDDAGKVVGVIELKWRVPPKDSDDPAARVVVKRIDDLPQR